MLKKLTILYALFLATIVVGANTGVLKPFLDWLHMLPWGDKVCHFVLVGMLSFLVSVTLSNKIRRWPKRTVVLGTIVILASLTSLEELSQSMLTFRRFSQGDLLANVLGTFCFGLVALFVPTQVAAEPTRDVAPQ